eukprot:g47893.t1
MFLLSTGIIMILSSLVNTQAESTETVRLRLENGGSPCAGRAEIHYKGLWGTVYDYKWDLMDATVLCRELECGTAVSVLVGSHFGPGSGPVVTGGILCSGTERALRDCLSAKWDHYVSAHANDAGVICSEHRAPRLAPGNNQCSGRLEVQFGDTWKTVCGLDWDLKNANVVCAQLQCGVAVTVSSPAHSGSSTVLMGTLVNTQVERTETVSLKLENGGSPCAGRVEIHYKGLWGTVDDIYWNLPDADVVCRELDCGTAVSALVGSHFGPGSGPIVTGKVWCSGTERALRDCPSAEWGHHTNPYANHSGVICSEHRAPRLEPGNSQCFGRLEVQFGDTWKTVCGLDWDLKNANVACAQLYCGVAVSVSSSAHSGGTTVLMGNEVLEYENWWPRLVNGESRCDGRIEIYYNGSWGIPQHTLWDLNGAHVVCRQLGCSYALETYNSSKYGENGGRLRVYGIQCLGEESQLRDCRISSPLNSSVTDSSDVGVLCS